MSTNIPIYNFVGMEVSQLELPEPVAYVDGRVSRGEKHYYKGVGMPYDHHFTDAVSPYDTVLGKSPVWYMDTKVRNNKIYGKHGIFLIKYQPQFTDFVGTCGAKEMSIVENSIAFELSSVEVIKSVNFDIEGNNMYYFIVDYKCSRNKYVDNPIYLFDLMKHMIQNHWNFIWDKNVITDITANGLVSDVADLFVSKQLTAKLGTAYSVLYSLFNKDIDAYNSFVKTFSRDFYHHNNMSFVWNAVRMLKLAGVDTTPLFYYGSGETEQNYKHIVRNYLVTGRNCGHCCYEGLGDKIKDEYIKRTDWMVK